MHSYNGQERRRAERIALTTFCPSKFTYKGKVLQALMTNLSELAENVKVGENPIGLTNEEIAPLMDWVGEIGKGFCRNCGYCLPCPEGISIPDIFRFEGYYDRYGLKRWAVEQYQSLPIKAEACSSCNQCLIRCLYGVPVPDRLKEIHLKLGPV